MILLLLFHPHCFVSGVVDVVQPLMRQLKDASRAFVSHAVIAFFLVLIGALVFEDNAEDYSTVISGALLCWESSSLLRATWPFCRGRPKPPRSGRGPRG